VIAGRAGGLRLVAPARDAARPTTDRVKESVFGALAQHHEIEGAVVLDLFAGSGALAIEALSRGAARAVLVERDTEAVDAIRRNLVTTRLASRARVQHSSVAAFLGGRAPAERPFDLVFLDPPYRTSGAEVTRALERLDASSWLAAHAVVVVERAAGASGVEWPTAWRAAWERSYGDTLVTVATTGAAT
jgi:16S rRNA (guanine966-N2)-methyltransferase